jgi:hypothetical protein
MFKSKNTSVKNLLLFAAITLFYPTLPASADSLSCEAGLGFYFSTDTKAYLLRYQHEAAPLFGFKSHYEISYATWNGPDHAEAIALARGIQWERIPDENLSLTAGFGRISRTTSNLGQPYEFYGRLAYAKSVGKALFSIGWIHYSDAKFLFGWTGPNNSENFATLSLGILF